MRSWGYVFLCLLLPVAWGVVSASLFDWVAARRDAGRARRGEAPTSDEEMY